jgi:hypothetical protein
MFSELSRVDPEIDDLSYLSQRVEDWADAVL